MKKNDFKRQAAALALLACSAPAHAGDTAGDTFDRYLAAVNSGDMATVRSLIAPDVERSDFIGCRSAMDNPSCLAYYIETTVIGPKARLVELQRQVEGDTAVARLEMRSALTAEMGVQRVLGRDIVRASDGLIRSFRFVPDFGDEQTAVFFGKLGIGPRAAQAAQQPPQR